MYENAEITTELLSSILKFAKINYFELVLNHRLFSEIFRTKSNLKKVQGRHIYKW